MNIRIFSIVLIAVLISNVACGPALYAACRASCYAAHTACMGLLTITTGPGKNN